MNTNATNTGIIYAAENPFLRDMVKIGLTKNTSTKRRMKELNGTNIPGRFTTRREVRVRNVKRTEEIIHTLLAEYRIDPAREFFGISSEQDPLGFQRFLGKVDNIFDIIDLQNSEEVEAVPVAAALPAEKDVYDFFYMRQEDVGPFIVEIDKRTGKPLSMKPGSIRNRERYRNNPAARAAQKISSAKWQKKKKEERQQQFELSRQTQSA